MSTPKFANVQNSFHVELKKRINQYFEQTGASPTGNKQLFFKAVLLMVSFFRIVYSPGIFYSLQQFGRLLECLLLGGVTAAIGFNVMHDGGHGSFSNNKTLNRVAAMSLNLLGGNSFMWNVKHNIIHHAFTNIDGIDDDINIQPWMRMSETQPKYKIHKYQHYYFWVLYSLLYILWMLVLDYTKYFKNKIGETPLKQMNTSDHILFWTWKALNIVMFIALPIYMVGFLPWLVGFPIFTVVTGFVISIVFQLAHTVEHTSFPMPDEMTGKLEDEWAIHQIKTTANFATDNRLVSWLVGGLNFQIEHHLFPKFLIFTIRRSARSSARPARNTVFTISNIQKFAMQLLRM